MKSNNFALTNYEIAYIILHGVMRFHTRGKKDADCHTSAAALVRNDGGGNAMRTDEGEKKTRIATPVLRHLLRNDRIGNAMRTDKTLLQVVSRTVIARQPAGCRGNPFSFGPPGASAPTGGTQLPRAASDTAPYGTARPTAGAGGQPNHRFLTGLCLGKNTS